MFRIPAKDILFTDWMTGGQVQQPAEVQEKKYGSFQVAGMHRQSPIFFMCSAKQLNTTNMASFVVLRHLVTLLSHYLINLTNLIMIFSFSNSLTFTSNNPWTLNIVTLWVLKAVLDKQMRCTNVNNFIKIHYNIEINVTYSCQFSTFFLLGELDLEYQGKGLRTIQIWKFSRVSKNSVLATL